MNGGKLLFVCNLYRKSVKGVALGPIVRGTLFQLQECVLFDASSLALTVKELCRPWNGHCCAANAGLHRNLQGRSSKPLET